MRLDTFKLITYQNIDLDERNVVTLLYQPIIGCKPYALYLTLWSLIDRSRLKSPEYVHRKLYDLLTLTPDAFLEVRKTLEAIGLLVVYQSDEMYLYELKAPVTAEEFIKDGTLGAYLYEKVGKTEFDSISSLFRISIPEKQGFKNITTNFDEVFTCVHDSVDTSDDFISRNKSRININHNFDFEVFLEGLSKNFIDRRKLTSKIREKIVNLSYVYNIDEITMQKVFMDSVDNDKNINVQKLSKRAKVWSDIINKERTNGAINSDSIEIDVNFKNVKEMCSNYSPIELITLSTGHKPAGREMTTLEKVVDDFDYPKEILNFLILYAMDNSNGELLPHFNFLESIYVGWKRSGVKTFDDAFNAVSKYKENKQQQSKNGKQTKKTEYEPEWLEDYMKEF